MHVSFGSPQHNCMVFRRVASVPLKVPGMCQLVLGWSSWEDGGGQSRANVRVCLWCAFITLMAVSFLSLPLSLSLFLFLLPTLLLAHAGRTHLSGLSQPKLDFCSCVFSFVCFFLSPLYMFQPVGFIVSPTHTIPDGGAPALVQPRAHLVSSSCPQMQQVPACSAPAQECLTLGLLEHGVLGSGAHKLWHCTRCGWL